MRLRLMSYNICAGAVGREREVLEVITTHAPDLLLLQEVLDRESARRIATTLGMSLHFAESNASTRNIALLSRLPVVRCEVFHPFPLLRTLLLATVSLDAGRRLHLYGVHLGLIYDLWRYYELRVILRRMRVYQGDARAPLALIAGDFNSVAPGDTLSYVGASPLVRMVLALQFHLAPRCTMRLLARSGYHDCFRQLHPHPQAAAAAGFTALAPQPGVRLDYIAASPALLPHLIGCSVLRSATADKGSDHYPLLAEFDL